MIKIISYKLLYFLTVYIPLRSRDIFIYFLKLFLGKTRSIELAYKFLKNVNIMGRLPDGNFLFYPLDDLKLLGIISEIYDKKIYDVNLIEQFEYICDIGAHIGIFTLRMSKKAPNSKIIAIEANPVNFKFLFNNIFINKLMDRVHIMNLAVGVRKGKVKLLLSMVSRGDTSAIKGHNAGNAGHLIIDMLPLDFILSDIKIYDFIKIDVEGMELDVLKGIGNKYHNIKGFIIEVHDLVVCITDIYNWLNKHGFVIIKIKKLYKNCTLLEARVIK